MDRRRWLFRLLACGLGIGVLFLVEASFALLGLGQADIHRDPFVGFEAIHPLFAPDESTNTLRISKSRLEFFCEDSFDSEKSHSEFRIFWLGGSTVQGRPFAIETSFTTWLEFNLKAVDPSIDWNVVNCGGVSYASYRLIPILEEILEYQPDLILIYTGHNEFLEDRTYSHIKQRPEWLDRVYVETSKLRLYRVIDGLVQMAFESSSRHDAAERPMLGTEVEALLDYQGGMKSYHHNAKWHGDITAHYRVNLERMVALCRQAKIPLVLFNPVSNLRDCPPFKSEHRPELTEQELVRWKDIFEQARAASFSNKFEAIRLYEKVLSIDDKHAGTHYLQAQCYEQLSRFPEARTAFVRAKDTDVCPLRILEPMSEALLDVASRTKTPLVDVNLLIGQRSKQGIPGHDWLIDHVHPSVEGYQLIAEATANKLINLRIVRPQNDTWTKRRDALCKAHMESLDEHYFLKGMDTLRAVRRWAHGRADRIKGSNE